MLYTKNEHSSLKKKFRSDQLQFPTDGVDFSRLIDFEVSICRPENSTSECCIEVQMNIVEDQVLEGEETLQVEMRSKDRSLVDLFSTATVAIRNDDSEW